MRRFGPFSRRPPPGLDAELVVADVRAEDVDPDALDKSPHRIDSRLLSPNSRGRTVDLNNFRTRDWYPALECAGFDQRGPHALRHTYATFLLDHVMSISPRVGRHKRPRPSGGRGREAGPARAKIRSHRTADVRGKYDSVCGFSRMRSCAGSRPFRA